MTKKVHTQFIEGKAVNLLDRANIYIYIYVTVHGKRAHSTHKTTLFYTGGFARPCSIE